MRASVRGSVAVAHPQRRFILLHPVSQSRLQDASIHFCCARRRPAGSHEGLKSFKRLVSCQARKATDSGAADDALLYAVFSGRKPGIYETWQGCREQIHRWQAGTGIFKPFSSRDAAQDWMLPGSAGHKFYSVRRGRRPGVYTDWDTFYEQIYRFQDSEFAYFDNRQEAAEWAREGRVNGDESKRDDLGQYWLFLGVAQQDNDFWTVISPCCRIILSDYPNADVAAMDYDLLCALFKHPITYYNFYDMACINEDERFEMAFRMLSSRKDKTLWNKALPLLKEDKVTFKTSSPSFEAYARSFGLTPASNAPPSHSVDKAPVAQATEKEAAPTKVLDHAATERLSAQITRLEKLIETRIATVMTSSQPAAVPTRAELAVAGGVDVARLTEKQRYEQARELLSKITDTSARRELVAVLDPKSLPAAEAEARAVVLSPVRPLAHNEAVVHLGRGLRDVTTGAQYLFFLAKTKLTNMRS